MNEDPDLPDEERGMYAKYRAFKILNDEEIDIPLVVEDRLGRDHQLTEVTDPFILLKFNNPNDSTALLAYANSVEDQYPLFAADIRDKLTEVNLEELRGRLMGSQGQTIPLGTVSTEQLSTPEGREEVVDDIMETLIDNGISLDYRDDTGMCERCETKHDTYKCPPLDMDV